jgi:type II secretory pathway pseudopilin PulG
MSTARIEEKQAPRVSRMAVPAFLSGPAGLLLLWWKPGDLAGTTLGLFLNVVFLIVLISPVVAIVLGAVAAFRIRGSQGKFKGLGLATMGVALGFISLFLLIFIPNLQTASRRSRRSIAASDAKTAVTVAIEYASDNGVYPTSINALREGEIVYCACPVKDRWGNDWVLSPVLTEGRTPREGDNVYVFSKGPKGTGVYPQPFTHDTGEDGAIGYSSVNGEFGFQTVK